MLLLAPFALAQSLFYSHIGACRSSPCTGGRCRKRQLSKDGRVSSASFSQAAFFFYPDTSTRGRSKREEKKEEPGQSPVLPFQNARRQKEDVEPAGGSSFPVAGVGGQQPAAASSAAACSFFFPFHLPSGRMPSTDAMPRVWNMTGATQRKASKARPHRRRCSRCITSFFSPSKSHQEKKEDLAT